MSEPKPIRILYMEDDAGLAYLVSKKLQQLGYVVDIAADGEQGLAMYDSGSYDLVAVDHGMPVHDGMDVIRMIASKRKLPPTIMVTGAGDEKTAVEAMKLGTRDYIVKDAQGAFLELLPSVIERVLNQQRLIEEKQRAEDELRKSEEKYRDLVENINDMIFATDDKGVITYISPVAESITEYALSELIGQHFSTLIYEEDLPVVKKGSQEPPLLDLMQNEYRIVTKSGKTRWVRLSSRPVYTGEELSGVNGVMTDISDSKKAEQARRELEAQLHQAQTLKTIGTLAGGVAHNFNNLLMVIQGYVTLMLDDIDSTHPHYNFLSHIKNQVKSGASLSAQLLGFARKGQYFVQAIQLNQLVQTTSGAFGATRKNISIRRELSYDLPFIEADEAQVEQVLLNLLVNASEAMPNGGHLTIKTANVSDKDMKGKLYIPKPGNYVELSIRDTGCGMDKKTAQRVFEPFFTTKEMGRGTGLGLASVYGIVKSHGGYIDVDSELGRGTTFTIYLPATEKKIEQTPEPSGQIIKGTGTILLVDDENMVMVVGTKLLQRLGYTVLKAGDGKEAVEIYKENRGKIDLVILDMVMPNMGGGEAYDKMKEINPNVKVLLSSGYSIDSEAKEILARGCDAFIQKPFDMEELSQKISEVMDRK